MVPMVPMVPGATALALCLALLLARLAHGEELASPQRVRFTTELVWNLLRWEPGHGCPSSARYDVEFIAYGMGIPWTAIPECSNTSELSCDLTHYTPDPERRYMAQVRAVSGNLTSPWQKTSIFSPQEVGVRLAGQSLSVVGNSIQVQLQLLPLPGNITPEFRELQKEMARYHVHLRRTQDNQTVTVVQNSTEFTIRGLFWLTEYCLSVEPRMANRPVPATQSDEQCVTTGPSDRSAEILPDILSSFFISLLLLGLLGALLACTYIRKTVRTPSVLKSFMKQSSLWVEHEPPSSGSLDADPIQQLFLCQKEPWLDRSPDSSTSAAQLPLEQGWKLPAQPKEQQGLLEPTGSRDSSGTSTDSGICLRIPSSTSSSSSASLSCPKPQGYRQQLPRAEDSGVGLENLCPAPGCSSGSDNASPGLSRATSQEGVQFRGYLQQSKGSVGPEQALDRGLSPSGCAGPVQDLGSTDTVLDMECPQLPVPKGYLKQSCPEHLLTQDLAPWGNPAWDCSSQPQAPTLPSWAAPAAPLTSKASPDLKTPFDLNIFNNTAFLGTLPFVSSLSSSWITPPLQPLSQLSGDSKDSRL